MPKPYTIKIFVPAGDPEGIRIIEKSNWSGAGLVIPRARFGEGELRRQMARTERSRAPRENGNPLLPSRGEAAVSGLGT
jgi:hypothetical protein